MKLPGYLLFALLAIAAAGPAAAERTAWKDPRHAAQFAYFIEQGRPDEKAWNAMPDQAQADAFKQAEAPAAQKLEAVTHWYAGVMKKWSSGQLRSYTSNITAKDLDTVKLWLGDAKAAEMKKKLAVTRPLLEKASRGGLEPGDEIALAPYLTPMAIGDLRALKTAAALKPQATPQTKEQEARKAELSARLDKVSASLSKPSADNGSKFFDGSNASGAAPVYAGGAPVKAGGNASSAALNLPSRGAAPGKTVAPAPLQPAAPVSLPETKSAKSAAWTSNAYGYTVTTTNGQTQTFRDGGKAAAAIRALPDGSITKIILYGHGSPGMQTVGPEVYDAESTSVLLKGKMAKGGVVQFAGCNTASIGGPTINPAVGLSMVARRLLYFSLPYFQDRADGVPAAQVREQWDKGWNADLAMDTSLKVKGAVVCGYRTFGLVPGRFPGVTRLMGNQEATTPGYVAGKKACYQDGREVPAP